MCPSNPTPRATAIRCSEAWCCGYSGRVSAAPCPRRGMCRTRPSTSSSPCADRRWRPTSRPCWLRRKISPADIANASLAGGVAIGSTCASENFYGMAFVIGLCAGALSTFGFAVIQPRLQGWLKKADTCGVLYLHGLPRPPGRPGRSSCHAPRAHAGPGDPVHRHRRAAGRPPHGPHPVRPGAQGPSPTATNRRYWSKPRKARELWSDRLLLKRFAARQRLELFRCPCGRKLVLVRLQSAAFI